MATGEETKKANQTRAQKVRAVHNERAKARADDINTVRSEYLKNADSFLLKDIIEKCKKFSAYHMSVARDGVAYDSEKNVIRFSNEERIGHLDKATGIQEIIDYIMRQTEDPAGKSMLEEVSQAEVEDEDSQAAAPEA